LSSGINCNAAWFLFWIASTFICPGVNHFLYKEYSSQNITPPVPELFPVSSLSALPPVILIVIVIIAALTPSTRAPVNIPRLKA